MVARTIFIWLSLSLFYLLIHPAWYGDAVWYAKSISDGTWVNFDFGHLIWRPIGYITWKAITPIYCDFDPLSALQIISAIFSGLIPVVSFLLAKKLSLSDKDSLFTALAISSSHFLLAYGASGSSYSPSLCLTILSIIFALNGRVFLSSLIFATAFSFWALAALNFPAFLIALYFHSKNIKSIVYASFATLLFLILYIVCCLALSNTSYDLLYQIKDSGHGIPIVLSATGLIRAILGTAITILHLGNVGTFIKGLIYGETGLLALRDIAPYAAKLILFLIITFLAALSLRKNYKNKIFLMFLASFVPTFCFAAIWQGSDIERLSPSLPIFIITFISFLNSKVYKTVFLLLIVVGNVFSLIIPNVIHKPLQLRFAEEAKNHLKPKSLIVATGQSINAVVGSVTEYYSDVRLYNVSIDVINNGVDNWQSRLENFSLEACKKNAEIAVISDFFGELTSGGLQLSLKESPTPSSVELVGYFSSWEKYDSFKIDRFLFYKVTPPFCID